MVDYRCQAPKAYILHRLTRSTEYHEAGMHKQEPQHSMRNQSQSKQDPRQSHMVLQALKVMPNIPAKGATQSELKSKTALLTVE